MKSRFLCLLTIGLFANPMFGGESIELTNNQQRVSYSIGADIGKTLKQQELDLDAGLLAAGIRDSISGKTALTEEEMKDIMRAFQKDMMAKMQAKEDAAASENLKAGDTFLAANAQKEGVKVLPSGLQYKILKSGSGKTPAASDTVKTHYHGTLIDGTVFDSSVERGEPVSFPVNGVIPGWTEALQLMKEGDKWQLFIPGKLAYGERGAGGRIGPNSTLIFEIELLAVE
ncbi:MAG: FKBP-type peptidyl-prolyl cis-trans isomerase [Verrucomicrobia bacterium]|jgi:FKBP-type peptidyl-prolyl cis-trans isomerase|nr:FKBP-type peptidyl-prolyl cis-trans isomerase [Verrucomicrobiota bacterium]